MLKREWDFGFNWATQVDDVRDVHREKNGGFSEIFPSPKYELIQNNGSNKKIEN